MKNKKRNPSNLMRLFLITVLIISGCKNKTLNEINYSLYTKPIAKLNSYKAIVIIPSKGCGGCITGAETFMIQNYQGNARKNIFYILTGHESKKSAKIKFGSIINNNNVYVDTTSRFNINPFFSTYPQFLRLDDGEVVNRQEINPNTSETIYNQIIE